MCFILRADKICYRDMLDELRKGVYKGRDKYPTTVPDAYKVLMRTSRQIVYVQIWPGRYGYHTENSGRCEGFMSAQNVGRGGRG